MNILWRGHRYPGGQFETDDKGRLFMSHAPVGLFTIAIWPAHLTDRDAQRIHRNENGDDWQSVMIKLAPVRVTGDECRDLRLPR